MIPHASTTQRNAPVMRPLRSVVTHASPSDTARVGHDRESRINLARRLAEIMGWSYDGDYNASADYANVAYFIPQDALLSADANALGIHGPEHLFGGVVPHAFIATKAITHPLIHRKAAAPEGWSHAFTAWAGDSVLHGYTAFSREDALLAATLLLREGPVRMKRVNGIGGSGQQLVSNADEIDTALASLDDDEFNLHGVAIEQHLDDNVTFSVGRVECNGETIAYCGTQRTVINAHGNEVYGGSTIDVVRGGFDTLLQSGLPDERHAAVDLARRYDAAAFAAYPRAFASRRNYDVLFGLDGSGRRRTGVLEQSWRIGGASGAELVAFDVFRRDRSRARVRCATVEIYDDKCPLPPNAFVYYRGIDDHAGPLTKFAIEIDGHDA